MSSRSLSDAEWKVMNAVWSGSGAVTARDVLESVEPDTGWAYTTVKTMLDRLVDKGALTARREGTAVTYRARLSRTKARGAAARSLVSKAFDGAVGPLVHYLVSAEDLSAEERDELRRMLAGQEDESRGIRARRGKATGAEDRPGGEGVNGASNRKGES